MAGRRRYYDWAVWPLALLLLALLVGAFTSLGLAVVGQQKLTNGTAASLGAVFTTWFIPIEFNEIFLDPGDRVPFMVEQAGLGIVRTPEYAFILPLSGVYACVAQTYSRSSIYFYNVVLNPGTTGAVMLPGSEFNSNAQFNEPGLSTISVLFNATAGDSLALVYNNSVSPTGRQMRIGAQETAVYNGYHQRPNAFIHIRRIA